MISAVVVVLIHLMILWLLTLHERASKVVNIAPKCLIVDSFDSSHTEDPSCTTFIASVRLGNSLDRVHLVCATREVAFPFQNPATSSS